MNKKMLVSLEERHSWILQQLAERWRASQAAVIRALLDAAAANLDLDVPTEMRSALDELTVAKIQKEIE